VISCKSCWLIGWLADVCWKLLNVLTCSFCKCFDALQIASIVYIWLIFSYRPVWHTGLYISLVCAKLNGMGHVVGLQYARVCELVTSRMCPVKCAGSCMAWRGMPHHATVWLFDLYISPFSLPLRPITYRAAMGAGDGRVYSGLWMPQRHASYSFWCKRDPSLSICTTVLKNEWE